MAQYTTGTVSVTNGSSTVTGTGTAFTTNVTAGDSFKVAAGLVTYTVASVTDNTHLVLTANYAEASGSGLNYQIARDWTPNYDLGEVNIGDVDWAIHLTQNTIRKLDTILASMEAGRVVVCANQAAEDAAPVNSIIVRTDLL